MQERKDLVLEGSGLLGYRKGGIQEWRDLGWEGYRITEA